MRILLIGRNGQLGWELQRTLAPLGDIIAVDYPEVDLSDVTGTRGLVRRIKPHIIVNAAAYTDVDKAENDQELAFALNATAPGILAEEAGMIGAALVHYSTDYVFDGGKGTPYTEADPPYPVNVYGKSKLMGEKAIQQAGGSFLVLRTSWVYSLRADNFVTRVLAWARKYQALRIVTDQEGSPTWCRMLAEASAQVLGTCRADIIGYLFEKKGVYHLAGSGSVSRFDWAKAILRCDPHRTEQVVKEILPAISADFPTPARRPPRSGLNCDRFYDTFNLRLPDWEETLLLGMQNS
jgi:dTDP-4-dehydrorhamnose reductase